MRLAIFSSIEKNLKYRKNMQKQKKSGNNPKKNTYTISTFSQTTKEQGIEKNLEDVHSKISKKLIIAHEEIKHLESYTINPRMH